MSLTADEALDSAVILGSNPSLSDDGSQAKTVWAELPDNLLLHIFCFLPPKEVLVAGEVCRNWHRLSKDELLWKYFLKDTLHNVGYSKNIELPNSSSWFAEFQRIHTKTPSVESQVLKEHTDEVLHVAFSHDGRLLASSSKDCSVILWSVDDCNCVSFERKINFQQHNWEFVQFCEFNANDTLLLVSGVASGQQLRGEIFIYELQESSMVDKNINEPYHLFGAWLSERCYLSGALEVIMEPAENGGRLWFSQLWANYVWKSTENLTYQTQSKVARVINHESWSVTLVHVARPNISSQSTYTSTALQGDDHDHVCLIFTSGTARNDQPHQVMLKWLKLPHNLNSPGGLNRLAAVMEACMTAHVHGQSDVIHAGGCEFCSRPDHCIDTNAHIIGMTVSPDHQYLHMNCRPFKNGADHDGEFGPDISNDISLQVYSLFTYELVGVYAGHQAYTNKDRCFFIFLDVADKLVASGAEDPCAHVWDRHFGVKLATLKGHSNVVNCVAFNPVNQEMLVSASDDHTIRVWKSRQLSRFKNDN